jgi:hypothetical protein
MYAADTAKPYLGRALQDEEFRDNLRAAFAAARAIYDELSRQRGVSGIASSVATDEDQGRKAEKSHTFRNVMLVVAGIAIGIFFNPFTGPTARRWVSGKASGSQDGYSPNGSS